MRIICISDTHNRIGKVDIPDGDVLVHAGDSTMMGRPEEIGKFAAYLEALPHKYKVVIAGNHDWLFETRPTTARKLIEDAGAIYLQDEAVTIMGHKFYGAPWQPWFQNWAFNVARGKALAAKWALIPTDTDVLITHGPPFGILDQVDGGEHLGCVDLRTAVDRVNPLLHVFGHIHDGYGLDARRELARTNFVNASICDESYQPVNSPIEIDL
jgi:Icc-related predicted phosphoesterase